MNLRSVDLNLLTIFDAIMTEGNMSRAAEKIGMSQPAMSAALARLRLTMKDELFIRTGHGVKPTPRALELERPIRNILDMINATLCRSLSFEHDNSNRVFNLASIDYGGIVVVPALIQHLQEIGSSVRVSIWPQYEPDLKDLMHFGTVDFTLDNIPIIDDDIHIKVVRKERGFCLARKGHPDIHDSLSLEQFLNIPQVVLYPKNDHLSMLDQHLLLSGIPRKHGMKVPSFFNMPYIVKGSDMICTLPERVARHFAELFDLNLFAAPVTDWEAPVYLMWHSRQHDDPGHQWLRNIIIDLCKASES